MNDKIFQILTQTDASKIMFTILQNPDLQACEIKEITNIPSTSLYRTLRFLESRGLIMSKTLENPDKKDTRVYRTKFSKLNLMTDTSGLKLVVN